MSRTVVCRKYGKELEGLDTPPLPGSKGEEIFNTVSKQAWSAWQQLQTYQAQIPALFAINAALVVSDGVEARIGCLSAGKEWFKPWRTISGETLARSEMAEMQVAIEGILQPSRLLAMLRDFIVFEDEGGEKLAKKMAGYHQFRHFLPVSGIDFILDVGVLRKESLVPLAQVKAMRRAGGQRGFDRGVKGGDGDVRPGQRRCRSCSRRCRPGRCSG